MLIKGRFDTSAHVKLFTKIARTCLELISHDGVVWRDVGKIISPIISFPRNSNFRWPASLDIPDRPLLPVGPRTWYVLLLVILLLRHTMVVGSSYSSATVVVVAILIVVAFVAVHSNSGIRLFLVLFLHLDLLVVVAADVVVEATG